MSCTSKSQSAAVEVCGHVRVLNLSSSFPSLRIFSNIYVGPPVRLVYTLLLVSHVIFIQAGAVNTIQGII